MATSPRRASVSEPQLRSPLVEGLFTLAGTPDDVPGLDTQLVMIAQLAADLVAPVAYASVTARRDVGYTTVAASSELARAVDQAQFADDDGPCLDALQTGAPFSVPSIAATMVWPGFRAAAHRLGLRASLSIPLFAGSGATIAVLNLYGHERDTMDALQRRVRALYDPTAPAGMASDGPGLDPGVEQLLAGLAAALGVRATIQKAIAVISANENCTTERAYLALRLLAAEMSTPLTLTAAITAME